MSKSYIINMHESYKYSVEEKVQCDSTSVVFKNMQT